jgi:hypothetical protein
VFFKNKFLNDKFIKNNKTNIFISSQPITEFYLKIKTNIFKSFITNILDEQNINNDYIN